MNFLEIMGAFYCIITLIVIICAVWAFITDKIEELTDKDRRDIYLENFNGYYYVKVEYIDSGDNKETVLCIDKEIVKSYNPRGLYSPNGFLEYIIRKFEIHNTGREHITSITMDVGLIEYFKIESSDGVIHDFKHLIDNVMG